MCVCVFKALVWAKQKGFTNNRQLKLNPPKKGFYPPTDSLNNKTGFTNQQTVYQPTDSLNNKTGILPTNTQHKQQNKGFYQQQTA